MIKRKKEAKKEKRVAIWKTEGVFHIPTRQTNNNNYYLSLKTKTLHCPAKPSHLSTVVVLIGKETHKREWVNWEIDKANEQGKRIVGVFLRGGTDADIPPSLEKYGSSIVGWNTTSILNAIEGENNFQNPDGTKRQGPNQGTSITC